MSNQLTIALAQLNFNVGDITGNVAKITDTAKNMKGRADLIVFSELSITGYPPDDLILRGRFVINAMEAAENLAKKTKHMPAMLVGCPWIVAGKLYNAALLIADGMIHDMALKRELPNYGVFDERRHFESHEHPRPLDWHGLKLGVMVCEDLWHDNVASSLVKQGAKILISLNASPFEATKHQRRLALGRKWVHKTKAPLIYVNQLCGQDELVFDGGSFVLDADAQLMCQLHDFKEHVEPVHFTREDHHWRIKKAKISEEPGKYALIYHALALGIRDYVTKNGFPGVTIGMSGGIDSALTAALAVDAIGVDKVRLVMLPSKYTSQESLDDAKECAELLGINIENIPIEPMVEGFTEALKPSFKGTKPDLTEENLQSRIRAVTLMALSNKFGHMLLTTGNKSEMAVGYATLYGDMCGGFNALKDLYKTEVFELCRWRNEQGRVIPERIISKPPSAELRANQKDEDSLPSYSILDVILIALIEERRSSDEIVAQGFDAETVNRIARLVKFAEYKRRQAPPGIKITRLAFGRDRRYPITNGFDF